MVPVLRIFSYMGLDTKVGTDQAGRGRGAEEKGRNVCHHQLGIAPPPKSTERLDKSSYPQRSRKMYATQDDLDEYKRLQASIKRAQNRQRVPSELEDLCSLDTRMSALLKAVRSATAPVSAEV